MQYEWYPDTFLLVVFLVDLTAFLTASCVLKKKIRIGRCLLLALSSASLETFLFLFMDHFFLYRLVMLCIANPLLICLLVRPKKVSELIGGYFTVTGVILFAGGMQNFFFQFFPSGQGKAAWCCFLAVVSGAICCIDRIRKTGRQHIMETRLVYQGKMLVLRSLVDTGNLLRDPFTAKPVSVVSKTALQAVFDLPEEKIRYIPYHTVGIDQGLMRVITIDKMYLLLADREVEIQDPVIGISKRELFSDHSIQMILNGMLLEGRQ